MSREHARTHLEYPEECISVRKVDLARRLLGWVELLEVWPGRKHAHVLVESSLVNLADDVTNQRPQMVAVLAYVVRVQLLVAV